VAPQVPADPVAEGGRARRDRLAGEPAAEIVGQFARRAVAARRLLLQALGDDPREVLGERRVERGSGVGSSRSTPRSVSSGESAANGEWPVSAK
jgi:hypothetical protein